MRTTLPLLLALCAIAALPGCRHFPATPVDSDPTLRIILECDRASVACNEPIPIAVLLQNPSTGAVRAECAKHNRYHSFAVVVTRDDGSVVDTPYDDPYFYRFDPHIRDGLERTPFELSDDDAEICLLPPGFEWKGIIGTTFFSCGGTDEDSTAEPAYLSLDEPGNYTIRVDYHFERAHAHGVAEEWDEPADFSDVPELHVRSNEIRIRVRNEGRVQD